MIPDHGGWLLADLSASPVDERRANAAFIVRAVNAHDALVAALAYFVEYAGDGANFVEDDVAEIAVTRKAMDDARAALALAAAEGVANG